MKLSVTDTRKIERFGFTDTEKTFKIKASSKAFEILYSKLYKNAIRAIVRELSCNAYDSHVAAGNPDVPFLIHLPNTLEPYFSVEDYGVGLSHDDIENIYTTMFESTKTDSDDFVGAWGLGSKTPFSYVDSFTVISTHNGEKNTYSAFLNERREPVIIRASSEKTRDGNGLKVIIPVDSSDDFTRFLNEAIYVFSYFPVTPIVVGNSEFKILEKNIIIEKEYWKIISVPSSSNMSGFWAKMGPVLYPIDSYSLQTNNPNDANSLNIINGISRIASKAMIIVDFNIGDLDVTASREEISYDDRTKKNIIKKLIQFTEELEDKINDDLSKRKTLYDANKFVYDIKRSANFANTRCFDWNGNKIFGYYCLDEKDHQDLNVYRLEYNLYTGIRKTRIVWDKSLNGNRLLVYPKDTVLLFNDYTKHSIIKAKGAAKEIFSKNISTPTIVYLFEPKDREKIDESFNKLVDFFGGFTITKTEGLKKPEKIATSSKKKINPRVITKKGYEYISTNVFCNFKYDSHVIDDDEFSIEDGGFYLISSNRSILDYTGKTINFMISPLLHIATKLNLIDKTKINIFSKSIADTYLNDDMSGEWIEFSEYLENKLIEYFKNMPDIEQHIYNKQKKSAVERSAYYKKHTMGMKLKTFTDARLDESHKLRKLIDEFEHYIIRSNNSIIFNLEEICKYSKKANNIFGEQLTKSDNEIFLYFNKKYDEVAEKYPIIFELFDGDSSFSSHLPYEDSYNPEKIKLYEKKMFDDIKFYIDMVDNKNIDGN